MAQEIRKQIRRTRTARSSAIFGALTIVALLVLSAAPALAHHKADHSQGGGNSAEARDHDGDADSDSSTAYTEDNDTNDGNTPNNVADEGDNKHPSGKDRSVESGGSGNQGKSESDPDDDGRGPDRSNGGPDKPNGSGGVDKADQDGNNGCGNDDDFEDDNEGLCLGRQKPRDEVAGITTEVAGITTEGEVGIEVRTDRVLPKAIKDAEVLGAKLNAAKPVARSAKVAGAVLPFTGGSVLTYVLSALSLISLGALSLLYRSDN